MKKLFILFIVLPFMAASQIHIDRDWASDINQIFQHLDKSKVSSGILLDYAMDFTEVPRFNGEQEEANKAVLNSIGNICKGSIFLCSRKRKNLNLKTT